MSGPIFLLVRLLIAIALYAFLLWALWLLWLELRRLTREQAAPVLPPLVLTLQQAGESQAYRFTAGEVIIGRDPACHLHLNERTLSAHHARLSYHHNQWWVEDLRSTNGTRLNSEVVDEPLVLTTGDLLHCGAVTFEVTIESVEGSSPQSRS